MPDGTCCNRRFVSADGRSCLTGRPPCGPGEFRNPQGACERLAPPVAAPPPTVVPPPVVAPPTCHRLNRQLTRIGLNRAHAVAAPTPPTRTGHDAPRGFHQSGILAQPSRRDREAEGGWTGRRGSVPVRRDGLDDHDAGPCESGFARQRDLHPAQGRRRRRRASVVAAPTAHEASDPFSQAEICFRQAIEIARSQQSKSLELRASSSLARLWAQNGKRTEACELLAPIYGWFTEGFGTPDLRDAEALLEALQ